MKTTLLLLCIATLAFTLTACTAAEIAATTAGVTASAAAIVEAIKPLMSPEDAARLTLIAAQVDGTVQATATALGQVVNAITQIRTGSEAQFATMQTAAQALAVQVAQAPDMSDVALVSGGSSLGTTAAGGAVLNSVRNATRKAALAVAPLATVRPV